jgi:hypothetical protein
VTANALNARLVDLADQAAESDTGADARSDIQPPRRPGVGDL